MDIFGTGGGGKPPHQFDPRMASMVIGGGLIAALVVVGDMVAFVRPPNNAAEYVLSVLPATVFLVVGDRVYANVVTAALYGGAVIIGGLWLMKLLERKVFKPMQVKKMMMEKELEERLINEAEDRRK